MCEIHLAVFTTIFFGVGPLPESKEWIEALQAFGVTCLLIGSFSAMITFFSTLVRGSAVALFTTVGFYLVFSTGLDILAEQYTVFESIRDYSVFEYMTRMSFETAQGGTFVMSLMRVAIVTLVLFTGIGMVLFQRKDIQ